MANIEDNSKDHDSNDDDDTSDDLATIFSLRTNAKRRHTKVVNRVKDLINTKRTVAKIEAQRPVIKEALKEVNDLHTRYISASVLNERDRETTQAWIDEVNQVSAKCSDDMDMYIMKLGTAPSSDEQNNATKKRKLQLQYELEQSKIEQDREIEDIKKRREREQEDLKPKINLESQIGESDDFAEFGLFSSTPRPAAPAPHLPYLPRVTITTFNGDPCQWVTFLSTFYATVHEANVSDLYKLLIFQENLTESVRRRMVHIFSPPYTYQTAFNELKAKYGSPEVIVQAHVNNLLMLPSIRTGDFKSLFELASLVRDAVTGAESKEHLQQYTYSTIVQQLSTKLPSELQREWGRHAYPLLPKVASLLDFDKWIDSVVGADEMRGTKFNQTSKPTRGQASAPAIHHINQIEENAEGTGRDRCSAGRKVIYHRLESCLAFLEMSSNQRAVICAENRHCFRCIGRGHYSRSCKKENTCTIAKCNRRHHTLIHGAERLFPQTPLLTPGDSLITDVIFVHSPSSSGSTVLLTIVPLIVQGQNRQIETCALLDPGSEATLICSALAERLGLHGQKIRIRFGTFCDSVTLTSQVVTFVVKAKDSSSSFKINKAFVVPEIRITHRKINWPLVKCHWPHLKNLNIPELDTTKVEV